MIRAIPKIITVKATGTIEFNERAIPVGTLSGILIINALNPIKNLKSSTDTNAEINPVNIAAAPK